MNEGLVGRYRELLVEIVGRAAQSHGYPLRAVEAAEIRLGVSIPTPLRDYYLSVGRHKLNQTHNRLRAPDAISVSQNRLVFMEENQCVVFWGVRNRTAATDPVVFQTTDPDDGDWAAETPCSHFLSAMLCWQAVGGGLPYTGYSAPLAPTAARQLAKGWSLVGRALGMSAFARGGRVVCVLAERKSAVAHIGARTRRDFRALAAELGVAVNET